MEGDEDEVERDDWGVEKANKGIGCNRKSNIAAQIPRKVQPYKKKNWRRVMNCLGQLVVELNWNLGG